MTQAGFRVALSCVGWLAAISLLAATAFADDGYLGIVGSNVVPLQSENITLSSEHVEVVVADGYASVTCIFTFTNSGPATTVLMGFPELQPSERRENTSLQDFTAEVDGVRVPVVYRLQDATPTPTSSATATTSVRPNGTPSGATASAMSLSTATATSSHNPTIVVPDAARRRYRAWHTFDVPFAEGQVRIVRNSYRGPLGGTSDGSHSFEYVLETGSTWLGAIADATIDVRWSFPPYLANGPAEPYGVYQAEPEGYTAGDHTLQWRFHNLEPGPRTTSASYSRRRSRFGAWRLQGLCSMRGSLPEPQWRPPPQGPGRHDQALPRRRPRRPQDPSQILRRRPPNVPA
jgi:hypothetical protein